MGLTLSQKMRMTVNRYGMLPVLSALGGLAMDDLQELENMPDFVQKQEDMPALREMVGLNIETLGSAYETMRDRAKIFEEKFPNP